MKQSYNIANIRKLIQNAFSGEEFELFCQDNYQKVYNNLHGKSQTERIILLIDFCMKNGGFEELLEKIKGINSYQFNQFQPYTLAGEDKVKHLSTEEKFYFWLDRKNQKNQFELVLEKLKKPEKPVCFFVHGFASDNSGALMQRLELRINEVFEKNTKRWALGQWAEGKNEEELAINLAIELKRNMEESGFAKLDFNDVLKDGSFICKVPVLKENIVILEWQIAMERWNNAFCNYLEKIYLNQYWNFPLAPENKPIFIFINMIYSSKKNFFSFSSKDKKVEKEIQLFCNNSKGRINHLERLNKITFLDAEPFFKRISPSLSLKNVMKENEELSFEDFFERAKPLVETYIKKMNDDAFFQ